MRDNFPYCSNQMSLGFLFKLKASSLIAYEFKNGETDGRDLERGFYFLNVDFNDLL